jgi:hypothetical protein
MTYRGIFRKNTGILKRKKMKKIIIVVVGLVINFFSSAQDKKEMDMSKKETSKQVLHSTYST